MSNNTNSLFWIITGAVVILSSFILVNTSKESFFTKASEKFSGLFNNQAGIKTVNNNEENNLIEEKVDEEDSELKRYYGHEPNYKSLKITDEKYFEFDPIEGVITDYTGEESTIVFPYEIGGVEVKKIIVDNFWNNHVSSEMCKILLDEYLSGSDDIYPPLMYSMIIAKVKNLPTNVEYINMFLDKNICEDLDIVACFNLTVALAYIEKVSEVE